MRFHTNFSTWLLCACIGCVGLQSCVKSDTHNVANIVASGVFDCFSDTIKNKDGSPATCEPSGLVYLHDKLVFVNDKKVTGLSSLMQVELNNLGINPPVESVENSTIKTGQKFEDMAMTNNGKLVFAITAFDRLLPNSSWDNYNMLICIRTDSMHKATVVSPSVRNNVMSSINLRGHFSKALADKIYPYGMPYFKIEGIATLPDNVLLIGFRETGKDNNSATQSINIVKVSYKYEKDTVMLNNDFKLAYSYNTSSLPEIKSPLGLSDIEYDTYNNRLYIITSYEQSPTIEGIGGYLWYVSLPDMEKHVPPTLVRTADGKPLFFTHKPESLAIIDQNTIFVLHDDDRVVENDSISKTFRRRNHQAAYDILKWQ